MVTDRRPSNDNLTLGPRTRGAATFNKHLRYKYYVAIQREMNKNAYWIMLYYRGTIDTSDNHVAHFSTNPVTQEEWNSYAWVRAG